MVVETYETLERANLSFSEGGLCKWSGSVSEHSVKLFCIRHYLFMHPSSTILVPIQCFSFHGICSHRMVLPKKPKWLTPMSLSLLTACHGTLSHTKDRYQVHALHVYHAKKIKTARLNDLFTGEALREKTESKRYYSADTVSLFVAQFVDRCLCSVESRDLTLVTSFYTQIVNKVLFAHESEAWVEGKLVRLEPEVPKLKSVVEKTFRRHYSSGLFRLKHYLLRKVEDNLKKSRHL